MRRSRDTEVYATKMIGRIQNSIKTKDELIKTKDELIKTKDELIKNMIQKLKVSL
jgi:restriction endonuclease S subunit